MITEARQDGQDPDLTAAPTDAAERTAPQSSRRRRWVIGSAASAVGVIALIGTMIVAGAESQTRLEAAKQECADDTTDVRIGDDGDSMVVSGVAAEEVEGANIVELLCLFKQLQVPDAVVSQISGTRALDGRQQATWGDFSASWTYHPDDGLNLILQEAK